MLEDSGVHLAAEFDELRDLVDFAVQYRYEAFDEPLTVDRADIAQRVGASVELVAGRVDSLSRP